MGIEFTPEMLAKLGMSAPKTPPQKKENTNSVKNNSSNVYDPKLATAPYNFVHLPTAVLPSPLDAYRDIFVKGDQEETRTAFRKYVENFTPQNGYIDLTIQTLTPIFIGGDVKTFAPAGKPIIPGSTLRGMIKNLVKINTLGAMRPEDDFHDRHLYYRCIMAQNSAPQWQKDLHDLYADRMTEGKTNKTKSGFLIKTKDGYAICPMKADRKKPERFLIGEYESTFGKTITPGMKDVRVEWEPTAGAAYAISGKTTKHLFKTWDEYTKYLEETARIEKKDPKAAGARRRSIGKQFVLQYPLADVDWNEEHRIPVRDDVVEEYRDDKNRRGVNLLNPVGDDPKKKGAAIDGKALWKMAPDAPKDIEMIAPCCYLSDGQSGPVCAFGHGHFFRVPHTFSIGHAIPEEIKRMENPVIDFADALFGANFLQKSASGSGRKQKPLWAGRVFFEDAHLAGGEARFEKTQPTHPLVGPNPTSFQLYLEQDKKIKSGDNDSLINWSSPDARIRGYKLYWHKDNAEWWATQTEKDQDKGKKAAERMTHDITPLSKNNTFTARIRFCNLSDIELGALLTVFHPNGAESLACKLGYAKSLGLGSVRITTQLNIETPADYVRLFGENGWNDPAKPADVQDYIHAFKNYVEEKHPDRAGEQRHISNQLSKMLDWENTKAIPDWNKRTAPMSGNVKADEVDSRYISRARLPEINEVVKSDRKAKDKKKGKP